MTEKTVVSCGGIVICRGKALVLYYKSKMGAGWVLPKGKAEANESHKQAALREVKEEAGAKARVIKPLGKTQYSFDRGSLTISKTVHWFLMVVDSFHCKPQAEENFVDVGFYKQHEAYHLLKYQDEKEMLSRAFIEYSKWRNSKIEKGGNHFG